jgi:hypothetical protein
VNTFSIFLACTATEVFPRVSKLFHYETFWIGLIDENNFQKLLHSISTYEIWSVNTFPNFLACTAIEVYTRFQKLFITKFGISLLVVRNLIEKFFTKMMPSKLILTFGIESFQIAARSRWQYKPEIQKSVHRVKFCFGIEFRKFLKRNRFSPSWTNSEIKYWKFSNRGKT